MNRVDYRGAFWFPVGPNDLWETIERFDRFDPRRGRFRDWVLGIARHLVSRHHRRVAAQNADDGSAQPFDALAPPDLLEQVERADTVRAALLCLGEDRRRVLLDRYVGGLAISEIAARTGLSAKAVESLLTRAREQLRALLRPYFSTSRGVERHEPSNAEPN